ncbi:MAG: hypothetical protein AAGG50_11125 [Bacteroidota bacterium]
MSKSPRKRATKNTPDAAQADTAQADAAQSKTLHVPKAGDTLLVTTTTRIRTSASPDFVPITAGDTLTLVKSNPGRGEVTTAAALPLVSAGILTTS